MDYQQSAKITADKIEYAARLQYLTILNREQYLQGRLDCSINKPRQNYNEFYQLGYTELLTSQIEQGDLVYYNIEFNTINCSKIFVKATLLAKVNNLLWRVKNIRIVDTSIANGNDYLREVLEVDSNHFVNVSRILIAKTFKS